MKLPGSIVWKLSALFVGCMVAVTLFHGLTIRRYVFQRQKEQRVRDLQLQLEIAAWELAATPGTSPHPDLGELGPGKEGRRMPPLFLLDMQGEVIARSGRRGPREPPAKLRELVRQVPADGGVLVEEDDEGRVYAARRIVLQEVPCVLVALTRAWTGGMGSPVPFGRKGLAPGRPRMGRPPVASFLLHRSLMVLAAAILAGVLGVRWITARLSVLEEGVSRLEEGDLSVRLDPGPSDEFGRLIHAFNSMAESLEGAHEELAAQDLARRELVADVSHELRTPLTAMLCHLELMLERAEGLPDEDAERLRVAVESGRALGARIQDLLTLARADVDALPLELDAVNLQRLIQGLLDRVRPQLEAAEVEIETEFLPDILEVRADPRRLEQVFGNLIDNARAAMFEGGTLTVRVLPVEAGEVTVEVEDTGTGIESGELPELFARFRRGSSGRDGGTGLGLAIVKRLVERHGGRCEVGSEPGEGTTFRVVLPVAPSEE